MATIKIANQTGHVGTQAAWDVITDDTFTHRASAVTEKGVQTLRLRDLRSREVIASRTSEKGQPLSLDEIVAWIHSEAKAHAGYLAAPAPSRDDITQARRLLAHLGWTDRLPRTRGNSPGWSDMVPIHSIRPLGEVATGESLEKARTYGLDLEAPDRGRLKVTAPTDSAYFAGMTPLVWADLQVQHLSDGMVIDWEGDLPPMPEAEVLASLRANVAERRRLHPLRVAAIQAARGRKTAEEIAAAAGMSKQGVYRVYRQDPPNVLVPEGDALQIIRDTLSAIQAADEERVRLMREARDLGVPATAIAHFAGVSDRTVRDLLK